MSPLRVEHNTDIQRLRSDGYNISIRGAYLFVYDVPYLSKDRVVKYGVLVTDLELRGNTTRPPTTHWVFWVGDRPLDADGAHALYGFSPAKRGKAIGGMVVDFLVSRKPLGGVYRDYHHKLTTYISLISAPVSQINLDFGSRDEPGQGA